MTDAKHCILVVDDDEDIRSSLADLLELVGHPTRTAENGQAALESLRGAPDLPCLILLDLMMPVMNGFQFLEAFRADPALSAIPVAIVTANGALGSDARERIQAPILTKPIAIERLFELVERVC